MDGVPDAKQMFPTQLISGLGYPPGVESSDVVRGAGRCIVTQAVELPHHYPTCSPLTPISSRLLELLNLSGPQARTNESH